MYIFVNCKMFLNLYLKYNIKLVEGDKLLQDDSDVTEELNNFFKEAVSTLDINENFYIINPTLKISQTLLKKL